MPFESLATRIEVPLPELPARWLPLIHLYDPDLPLFPTHYIHVSHPVTGRPAAADRTFGYIERVTVPLAGDPSVTVVCNKTAEQLGTEGVARLTREVKERLGLAKSVVQADVQTAFAAPMLAANAFLTELWERVVANHYGGRLPFGRLWDEVMGLARWVASWNSQSGRKGELIQTHYFASRFGEKIQSAGTVPQVDFFLLPSITELQDPANTLNLFPRFRRLVELAEAFQAAFCNVRNVAGVQISGFTNPAGGKFDTASLFACFNALPAAYLETATECFNAFGKGPQRTVIFLMNLADLRANRLSPGAINSVQFSALQDGLGGSYNSPKAIQIYSQQSWGNPAAMPIDTWMDAFFKLPLRAPRRGRDAQAVDWPAVFAASATLGKVERLLWVAGQARKVHSSACDDALWCLKFASDGARGPNPLACTICNPAILNVCPAFASIGPATVGFNANVPGARFRVQTSGGNNTTPGQAFVASYGLGASAGSTDDFSPRDQPNGYQTYPVAGHAGTPLTVQQFVQRYRR